MIEELKSEAIEQGAMQKMLRKQDKYWKLHEYGLWIIENWKQRRHKTWTVIQSIRKQYDKFWDLIGQKMMERSQDDW